MVDSQSCEATRTSSANRQLAAPRFLVDDGRTVHSSRGVPLPQALDAIRLMIFIRTHSAYALSVPCFPCDLRKHLVGHLR